MSKRDAAKVHARLMRERKSALAWMLVCMAIAYFGERSA